MNFCLIESFLSHALRAQRPQPLKCSLWSHAAFEDRDINVRTHSAAAVVVHLTVMERTQGEAGFASWLSVKEVLFPPLAEQSAHSHSDADTDTATKLTRKKPFLFCSFILFKGSFQRRNWTPQAMLYLKGTRMLTSSPNASIRLAE